GGSAIRGYRCSPTVETWQEPRKKERRDRSHRAGGFPPQSACGTTTRRRRSSPRPASPDRGTAARGGRGTVSYVGRLLLPARTGTRAAAVTADARIDRPGLAPVARRT